MKDFAVQFSIISLPAAARRCSGKRLHYMLNSFSHTASEHRRRLKIPDITVKTSQCQSVKHI